MAEAAALEADAVAVAVCGAARIIFDHPAQLAARTLEAAALPLDAHAHVVAL